MQWGRLTDLIENGKGLSYASTLFFVFKNEYTQLFAIELVTGAPNISEYGQLFLYGVDGEGVALTALGGDYSPITVAIKKDTGLPFDRVTLYQDGDFYRSFKFLQQKNGFVLEADTDKRDETTGEVEDLRARWGEHILDMNDDSINKLNIEVLPRIIDHVIGQLLQ